MIKGNQKTVASAAYPEVDITKEMKYHAQLRADKIPLTIKNSILNGRGRFCGAIGEQAFIDLSKGKESTGRSVWNFDVILPNGKLCEVKTKERSVPPKSHYACSVAKANDKQECDYYIFASTLPDYSKVWIVGYIEREELKTKGVFRKKGDFDPDNGQTCSADCWNIRIDQLKDIKEIL